MSEPSGKQERQRTWLGRKLRVFPDPLMAWVYHWLDLNGRDGRPDHGKVFGAVSFAWGLIVLWTLHGELTTHAELLPFFMGFAALIFLTPYGIRGIAMWLKSRGGGTVEATAQAADAAIAARRAAAGGDHEPTP